MASERLQVLLVTRKWPPAVGGMETYGWELTQELEKASAISFHKRFLPGRSDGRPPHALATVWFFLATAWHLVTHKNEYDVVHFGDMVQIGLACVNRLRSPHTRNVVALHGLDVVYGRRAGFLPRIYKWYLAWARRRACIDCYIANSRNTARLLKEQGFDPVVVVPLGVRLTEDRSRPSIAPIADNRFVLFFGRVFRRKGPRWFAEHVLPLLPDDVQFFVVGTVWDVKDGEYLQQHSRVRMLGSFPIDISRDQFESLKREAIAIVMPNVRNPEEKDVEGFGLIALEAADHGAPLVAADLEGIRDAVLDGQTGFLVEAENAAAWADKINDLKDWSVEQRRQFADGSGRTLREYFSWARVAQDTIAAYKGGGNYYEET